jgi:hypothetical protein
MADSFNITNPATEALRKCDIGELVCIEAALQRIFDAANAAENEPRCGENGTPFIGTFIIAGSRLARSGNCRAEKPDA